jgi:hypothetical protein
MSEELKKRIDAMSYTQMLAKWRFAPSGDPLFVGEVGDYFKAKMGERRKEISDGEAVQISKDIGW